METKAFEFVLMNIPSENESWAIAEEHIELRGLIEITTTSKEKKFVRQLARQRGKSIPWLVMGISNSCEQPEGNCRNLSVVKRLIINNRSSWKAKDLPMLNLKMGWTVCWLRLMTIMMKVFSLILV